MAKKNNMLNNFVVVESSSNKDMILKTLKKIKKVNGEVRRISIGISGDVYREHGSKTVSAAEYGAELDSGVYGRGRYHFSDGDGVGDIYDDILKEPEIQKSINGIVSGKRRGSKEMDRISEIAAKMVVRKITSFIDAGAHRHYQWWKGGNDSNLIETGALRHAIFGQVVHDTGRIIWRGQ